MNAITLVFLDGNHLNLSQRTIEAGKRSGIQTISWWLFGKLAKGSFLPTAAPYLGFEWIAPGPTSGFSNLRVLDKGKGIAIDDDTDDENIMGDEYPYKLRVLFNGTVYETVSSIYLSKALGNRGKDPIIINK